MVKTAAWRSNISSSWIMTVSNTTVIVAGVMLVNRSVQLVNTFGNVNFFAMVNPRSPSPSSSPSSPSLATPKRRDNVDSCRRMLVVPGGSGAADAKEEEGASSVDSSATAGAEPGAMALTILFSRVHVACLLDCQVLTFPPPTSYYDVGAAADSADWWSDERQVAGGDVLDPYDAASTGFDFAGDGCPLRLDPAAGGGPPPPESSPATAAFNDAVLRIVVSGTTLHQWEVLSDGRRGVPPSAARFGWSLDGNNHSIQVRAMRGREKPSSATPSAPLGCAIVCDQLLRLAGNMSGSRFLPCAQDNATCRPNDIPAPSSSRRQLRQLCGVLMRDAMTTVGLLKCDILQSSSSAAQAVGAAASGDVEGGGDPTAFCQSAMRRLRDVQGEIETKEPLQEEEEGGGPSPLHCFSPHVEGRAPSLESLPPARGVVIFLLSRAGHSHHRSLRHALFTAGAVRHRSRVT